MSYSVNKKKIEKAFEKVLASTEKKSFRAISDGTKVGYDYALDLHKKAKHELHLILGGDFGYAVAQDGELMKSDVVEGKAVVYATAVTALEEHIADAPKSGVLGVVSAGMESAPFNDSWEKSALKSAFNKAKAVAIKEFNR